MKNKLSFLAAAFLVLALGVPGTILAVPAVPPPPTNPGLQITAGEVLFQQRCSGCHGTVGQGKTGVSLTSGNTTITANVPAIKGRTATEINVALDNNPFMAGVAANIDRATQVPPIAGFLQEIGLPQITLAQPATGQIAPGILNTIQATFTSATSVITSAEFQTFFSDAPGTLSAIEVATQSPLGVPTPRAGAAASAVDPTPAPAGAPAASIGLAVVTGTVTAMNPAIGEWQIGTPPVVVYDSAGTALVGNPAVGTVVRVEALRTFAAGPLVARQIAQLAGDVVPTAAPRKDLSFLFNGTIEAVVLPIETAGTRVGGQKWRIGGADFLIDDPASPAVISPGMGVGSPVTVRYTALAAIPSGNTALEIFAPQKSDVIPSPLHPTPVSNTDLLPLNPPTGSWVQFVIGGVVSSANVTSGEWMIGTPPVAVYSSNATAITGAVTPGNEVLVIGRRDLPASPIVADSIAAVVRPVPLPAGPPVVEKSFFVNGTASAVSATGWTINGVVYTINDAQTPAVIGAGLGQGSAVTVEFRASTPPTPAANVWAAIGLPFAFNAPSVTASATVNPPAVTSVRNGFIFLRATDGVQRTNTVVIPATLGAVAAPPPPPAPVGGGGFSGGGGGGGGAPASTNVALTGLSGTLALNSSGAAQSTTTLSNAAGTVSLSIASGTVLKTSTGSNLSSMSVATPATTPSAPQGKVVVMVQDFGPDGATFNPALKLTLGYSDSSLPAGVNEQSLVIARWDGTRWLIETSTVNAAANTVSADIAHFTVYAILGDVATPTPQPTSPATTTTRPTTTTPAVTTTQPATTPAQTTTRPVTTSPVTTPPTTTPGGGTNTGLIVGIIGALIVVVVVIVLIARRKPAAK